MAARVAMLAAATRLVFLTVGCISDYLLPDYDTSSQLLLRGCKSDGPLDAASELVRISSSSVVWDVVYFDRIAQCGYEYEQFYAFYPALPRLVGLLAAALGAQHASLIRPVAAIAVTLAAFTVAAVLLYILGCHTLRDRKKAALAVLVLCASPATVFLTYGYTEALFLAATTLGLCALHVWQLPLVAALAFGLSCTIRSNGVINGAFLLYEAASLVSKSWQGNLAWSASIPTAMHLVTGAALVLVSASLTLAPGYEAFCRKWPWQTSPSPRPFCLPHGPSLYSHVQSAYWAVGFLKYYTFKQLPNFLVAAPILLFSFAATAAYLSRDWSRALSLGGLGPPQFLHCLRQLADFRFSTSPTASVRSFANPESPALVKAHARSGASRKRRGIAIADTTTSEAMTELGSPHSEARSHQHRSEPSGAADCSEPQRQGTVAAKGASSGFFADGCFVYVAHLAAMALFATLFMHIQVATRFLSSCPAIYWYAAEHLSGHLSKRSATSTRALLAYCCLWAWAGLVLFPNFYPWT